MLAVMQPAMKHWQKRPLHRLLVDYAVSGVVPVWSLAEKMIKKVGDAGVAGTIRMSKQAMQFYFEDADKEPADQDSRYICLFAQIL